MKRYLLALLLLLWGPVAWGDMTPAEYADLAARQGYGTYWNHTQEDGETVLIGAWVDSNGDVVNAYRFPSSGEGEAEYAGGDFYEWHEERLGFSAIGGGGTGSACQGFVICDPYENPNPGFNDVY